MKLEKEYYASPRWSWEILDCAMPMTFDTYSNCAHQCVYCFAFFQRAVGKGADDYLHHKVKAVNVDKVKALFLDPDNATGASAQFAWYIKNRYVLQWGGLSDGFDYYERKFRKSLELLKFFVEIDYPISISTKGTWFVDEPEYREVLQGAKNVHFKYSIITTNEQHAKKLEAGTPSPKERFRALEKLAVLGIGATTLRLRPYVIGASDLCVDDLFQEAHNAGVYSITTEVLCIEKRAGANHKARYEEISKVVGYDVWEYYRNNSYSGSGLMRLNYELKRPHIRRMEQLAQQYDIPFYVSDAHHKEASASGGCCGLPHKGVLSNYNKGQFSEAMQIAKANGQVRWSDIAAEAEVLKNIPFYAAEGFNQGNTRTRAKMRYHSMFDYMHDMWNNITSWSSPARYFGGALVPSGKDDNDDVIYTYNEPFIEDGKRVSDVIELKAMVVDRREEMKADGSAMGHVAYPVYAIFDSGGSLHGMLDKSRLVYTKVASEAEAKIDATGERYVQYWLLSEPFDIPSGAPNLRGLLSALERDMVHAHPNANHCYVHEASFDD